MATTVSRRLVFIKMKKTNKPHVPLPKQRPAPSSSSDEMVGEAARPMVMRAPLRREAPRAWWQKALKPAGAAFGLLVCGGFLYVVLNASGRPATAYDRSVETVSMQTPTASRRLARAAAYPGSDEVTLPVVLSKRSAPTAESFRAGAYVRKKVELPNLAGECVVKGGLDRVLGECLRGQEGQ